nr:hypothetical protein [Tanacetum cinerariifolium]
MLEETIDVLTFKRKLLRDLMRLAMFKGLFGIHLREILPLFDATTVVEKDNMQGIIQSQEFGTQNTSWQMSEKEDSCHDTIIDLEDKLKKNVDLILKLGNSLQGMFMLEPKPLSMYDQQLKHGLGYSNPYTLKQAISQCPKLYLASSLGNSEILLNVKDNEDTLDDASKIQQKISYEMIRAYWFPTFGIRASVGFRDRPPMLAPGRYPQWCSRFLRYVDTRPNGEALRKCILSGPYKLTTVLVHAVEVTDDSPTVPEHTTVKTPTNMSPENKAHFLAEKEVIHLILTGIGDDIYSTVDAFQIA